MKSKNEEHLDKLLQSLKNDSNSGIAKTTNKGDDIDLTEAISSSSENNDLNEIGQMLNQLDSGELLDSGMTSVLESISAPVDVTLPKYTIGEEIGEGYEKDD